MQGRLCIRARRRWHFARALSELSFAHLREYVLPFSGCRFRYLVVFSFVFCGCSFCQRRTFLQSQILHQPSSPSLVLLFRCQNSGLRSNISLHLGHIFGGNTTLGLYSGISFANLPRRGLRPRTRTRTIESVPTGPDNVHSVGLAVFYLFFCSIMRFV